MPDSYDVIVIGGGPAGYVAAIRAAQLGLSTACVEQWINKQEKPALGGTCLNVGCIPSKALLESTELYDEAKNNFADLGINTGEVTLDVPKMIGRKDKIVQELTGGIEMLFKQNGIDWLQGTGQLLGDKKVKVTSQDNKSTEYQAGNVIIATVSVPIALSATPLEGNWVAFGAGLVLKLYCLKLKMIFFPWSIKRLLEMLNEPLKSRVWTFVWQLVSLVVMSKARRSQSVSVTRQVSMKRCLTS